MPPRRTRPRARRSYLGDVASEGTSSSTRHTRPLSPARCGRLSLVNQRVLPVQELGFEKNVMNAISGDRVRRSNRVQDDPQDHATAVPRKRSKARRRPQEAGSWKTRPRLTAVRPCQQLHQVHTSSVGQAFLILIREGLEALLVVAAVIAYLEVGQQALHQVHLSRRTRRLGGSSLIAVLFTFLFSGSGPIQRKFPKACARSSPWPCCCGPATGCSTRAPWKRGTAISATKPKPLWPARKARWRPVKA